MMTPEGERALVEARLKRNGLTPEQIKAILEKTK